MPFHPESTGPELNYYRLAGTGITVMSQPRGPVEPARRAAHTDPMAALRVE
jgi:hypothetical protein